MVSNQPKKDLILGFATRYSFEQIKVFFSSLNKTDFIGDVVLVADPKMVIPKENKYNFNVTILNEPLFDRGILTLGFAKIMVMFVPNLSKNILAWTLKRIKNEDTFLKWFIKTNYVASSRYAFYYKFLKDKQYRNILLTDTRDVYFQDNPFKNFNYELAVFEEAKMYKLKTDEYNSAWVKKAFGEKILDVIGDNTVCCSGTIMGSQSGIMRFLKVFLDTCMKYNVSYKIVGVDQGVFNFVIYSGLLEFGKICLNGDRILTIPRDPLKDIFLVDGKVVYNNSEPNIVHQFDRHKNLIEFIHKQVDS